MTKDEALKMALGVLETPWNAPYVDGCDLALGKKVKAITAIKEALAQPEPVAWEQFYPEMGSPKLAYLPPTESPDNACYTPPQRTWVGLDVEDYIKALELCDFDKEAAFEFFESKLRSKNS